MRVRMMFERFRIHRLPLLVGGAVLAAVLLLLGIVAVAVRLSGGSTSASTASIQLHGSPAAPAFSSDTETTPSPKATDVERWDAIPPVIAAVSTAFPAIAATACRDPDAYARAFSIELFTRDYLTSTRAQLISWAQSEDAPLRSPNYPTADWTKVLVDSLTDLTWDAADDTPIPADGPWLALQAERGQESASDVKVSLDPQWEQRIRGGYQPPDPLTTVRDVSLTVTQRSTAGAVAAMSTYSVSLDLQLGTSTRGSCYGVSATNNYVAKEMG